MSWFYVILIIYLIMYLIFAKASGSFFKSIIYTAILGVVLLVAVNFIGGRFGFNCPINIYTVTFCSLLGVPGVIFLLICNLIFI